MTTTSIRLQNLAQFKRRQEARQRFRNVIRSVAIHKRWLMDKEDQKLTLNVKKNISAIVRTYQKIGVLTMAEKAIIRLAHANRTVQQRKTLVKTLVNLLCFAILPPKIRARLVPIISFSYVEAGNKLINQGGEPLGIYFILTGEVEVSKTIHSEVTGKLETRSDIIHGPGDSFGEVELLENCRRLNTYTASTDVELLVVHWDDFDRILRPYMAEQWANKKRALQELEYFNVFTEEQILTACKMSYIRQFEPLENIYFEDKGKATYVHFVLSGECMVLQYLQINVVECKGHPPDFHLSKYIQGETLFATLSKVELMKMMRENFSADMLSRHTISKDEMSDDEKKDSRRKTVQQARKSIRAIETLCGVRGEDSKMNMSDFLSLHGITTHASQATLFKNRNSLPDEDIKFDEEHEENGEEGTFDNVHENDYTSMTLPRSKSTKTTISISPSVRIMETFKKRKNRRESSEQQEFEDDLSSLRQTIDPSYTHSLRYEPEDSSSSEASIYSDSTYSTSSASQGRTSPQTTFSESSLSSESIEKVGCKKRSENHFIDVGSIFYGGIFGLGEPLEHRVIMARTTVQCLMIPRFWLLEHTQNQANIWNRRRFAIEKMLPSRKDLFKNFLTTRNWDKFKSDYIRNQTKFGANLHNTKPQDVPVYGRILQPNDDNI